jgi:hypothetical protein
VTNFDMIKAVLRCDDIHAQKVYRSMVLLQYQFDRHLLQDFVTAVRQVSEASKNLDRRPPCDALTAQQKAQEPMM